MMYIVDCKNSLDFVLVRHLGDKLIGMISAVTYTIGDVTVMIEFFGDFGQGMTIGTEDFFYKEQNGYNGYEKGQKRGGSIMMSPTQPLIC